MECGGDNDMARRRNCEAIAAARAIRSGAAAQFHVLGLRNGCKRYAGGQCCYNCQPLAAMMLLSQHFLF